MFNIHFSSDLGAVQQSYMSASNTAEKLAVILQVYRSDDEGIDATPVQENIRQICEQYVNGAGVRIICVEHEETQLTPPSPDAQLSDLVNYTSVSAAVQKLISQYPEQTEAWGVDNLELIRRSYTAMNRLKSSLDRQHIFFQRLCDFLYDAQAMYYSNELAELRRSTIKLYQVSDRSSDLPLAQQTSLINKIAENVGLDLQHFPVYSAFATSMSLENSIDFKRVEAQRAKFISQATNRVLAWCEHVQEGRKEIDKEITSRIIQLWMADTKLTLSELEHNLRLRGFENILREAADWLQNWLVESAFRIRLTGRGFGRETEVDYYERLAQLEHNDRSSIINLQDFYNYVAYRQKVDEGITPRSLMSELRECEKALIEKFDQPAVTRLSQIEDKLSVIYFALQIKQNPLDAEVSEIPPGKLIEVVQDLFDLVGKAKIPKDIYRDLNILDPLLADATEFPRLSRKRGQIMIRKTLDIMRKHREDRALLVVGGFHQRAIIRELERNRQVSWQLVVPKIDISTVRR